MGLLTKRGPTGDGSTSAPAPRVTSIADLSGRATSKRALFTLADQSLSSVSNFAVGVVVARLAGPAGLGAFSLAYAAWQLLVTQHRSLVTDPMAIEGDASAPGNRRGILQGLAAELILGAGAAVLLALLGLVTLACGQRTFGLALLAVAPWLPALVVQDFWRWIGFMTAQPINALVNDLVVDVVQVGAFVSVFLGGFRGSVPIIAAWGVASSAGAVYGVWQYRLFKLGSQSLNFSYAADSIRGFFSAGPVLLRRRWRIGRWIAGNALLSWVSSQGYILVAGFILGPVGLGGLKAAQQLVTGPSMVLIQASGSVGLPEASRAYAERGWPGLIRIARIISTIGVVSVGSMTLLMAFAGRDLLTLVYGASFAYLRWTAVFIGSGLTLSMSGMGCLLVMKVTRHTRYLMYTVSATLPVSIGGVALLSRIYGVNGAAIVSVAVAVVGATGVRWFQYRSHQSIQKEGGGVTAERNHHLGGDRGPVQAAATPVPPDLEAG